MIQLTLNKIAYYFIFLTLLLINKIDSQKESKAQNTTCWADGKSKDPYFIGDGFTCCNNLFLEHPLLSKNEHWRKCLSQQHGDPNDDIPNTMWNVYMCEITNAASISIEGFQSYKQFESFFMKNYPEEMKKRMIEKEPNCAINESLSKSASRLKFYEECFWKTEEIVCFEMAAVNTVIISKPNETICEPVNSLSNPNHSFSTFAKPCCKGQELPYPLFDIFMDFERFDISESVIKCTETHKNRLKELNANESLIDFDAPLSICEVACVHEVDGFKGKYNADFQDLLNFKMKTVSNSTRKELMKIMTKYNPMFQLFGKNETETSLQIPMYQVDSVISKLNESDKIINYCKFHFEATAEAYRALFEYCYNEEYGQQFRDDILNSAFNED